MMMDFAAAAAAKAGQYARFATGGRFLRIEDRPTNGLGFIYQRQLDGTFKRIFGL